MPPKSADTRQSWPRSRLTLSWPPVTRRSRLCYRRPAPCRSCFAVANDPVAAGYVDRLARPGGNATGFMVFDYSLSGKWLELLKEIAPGVTRVVVLRDATQGSGASQFAVIQALAPSLRVEVNPANLRDAGEIEDAVAQFARVPNGGLIVTSGAGAIAHRDLIITQAAQPQVTRGLLGALLRGGWRLGLLWTRYSRQLSARGRLCRSHP